MKLVLFLSLIVLALLKKKKYVREDTVLVLNDKNFNKTIHHFNHLLVVFYASWCGHCQQFLPIFTKASLLLYKNKPRINLAKIEMSSNPITAKAYDIHSYPTLKFFKDGVAYNYTGMNSDIGIAQWMKKKTQPTISELYTLSDISTFKNTHEVAVIFFGNDTNIEKMLFDIAIEDSDNFYGKCDFATAYSSYNTRHNTIVLYKKYGEERTELSGKITKSGIERFISKYSINKVMTFNEKTARFVFKDKNPALFLFRDPNGHKSDYYESIIRGLADQLFDRIRVVIGGILSYEEQNLNSLTNVKVSELPCIRIYDPRKKMNAYYVMKGEINEKNILNFVSEWEQGKLKEAMKSEAPITKQKGKIFETVGSTYEHDIIHNDFNSLVLYYSPYLDESKAFMTTYEKIAEHFNAKKELNMRISMIDMSRNELALEEKITSLPTIRLYMKGSKDKGVEYKGEKKYDDIVSFVYSNLGVDIESEEKKNLSLDDDEL